MEFEELLRKLEQIEKEEKELLISLLERERLSFKGFDQLSRLLYERRKIHALLRNTALPAEENKIYRYRSRIEKILRQEKELKELFLKLKAKIISLQKEFTHRQRVISNYQNPLY